MGETLTFEGLDEILARIERMESNMDKLKDEALIAGGDLLQEAIQSQVYSHGLTRRSGEAQEAIVRTDPENGELFVGTQGGRQAPGFYLYMHEFGYYNVRARRFIGPKPLVSVVFNSVQHLILQAELQVLKKGLGL